MGVRRETWPGSKIETVFGRGRVKILKNERLNQGRTQGSGNEKKQRGLQERERKSFPFRLRRILWGAAWGWEYKREIKPVGPSISPQVENKVIRYRWECGEQERLEANETQIPPISCTGSPGINEWLRQKKSYEHQWRPGENCMSIICFFRSAPLFVFLRIDLRLTRLSRDSLLLVENKAWLWNSPWMASILCFVPFELP